MTRVSAATTGGGIWRRKYHAVEYASQLTVTDGVAYTKPGGEPVVGFTDVRRYRDLELECGSGYITRADPPYNWHFHCGFIACHALVGRYERSTSIEQARAAAERAADLLLGIGFTPSYSYGPAVIPRHERAARLEWTDQNGWYHPWPEGVRGATAMLNGDLGIELRINNYDHHNLSAGPQLRPEGWAEWWVTGRFGYVSVSVIGETQGFEAGKRDAESVAIMLGDLGMRGPNCGIGAFGQDGARLTDRVSCDLPRSHVLPIHRCYDDDGGLLAEWEYAMAARA